jgi:hypothetical protein
MHDSCNGKIEEVFPKGLELRANIFMKNLQSVPPALQFLLAHGNALEIVVIVVHD